MMFLKIIGRIWAKHTEPLKYWKIFFSKSCAHKMTIPRQQKVPRYLDSSPQIMAVSADTDTFGSWHELPAHVRLSGAADTSYRSFCCSVCLHFGLHTLCLRQKEIVWSHEIHTTYHTNMGQKVLLGLINSIFYIIRLHLLSSQQRNADRKMSWD